MSDGREEREEQKKRREQKANEDREDWLDRSGGDDPEQERQDS
jgi:hypothetical protein